MTRPSTSILVAALLLSGCRTPHLGAGTGTAFHAALDAQVDAATHPDDGPSFDADVARGALAARRRDPAARTPAARTTTAVMTTAPASSSNGPITLEAK